MRSDFSLNAVPGQGVKKHARCFSIFVPTPQRCPPPCVIPGICAIHVVSNIYITTGIYRGVRFVPSQTPDTIKFMYIVILILTSVTPPNMTGAIREAPRTFKATSKCRLLLLSYHLHKIISEYKHHVIANISSTFLLSSYIDHTTTTVHHPLFTSVCSFSTLRLNLVLTHGVPPDFRGGVHLFI